MTIKNGCVAGHFYWEDDRHRYLDEFCIKINDQNEIVDIDKLRTNTADGGYVNSCRYTNVHNVEFDRLFNASTIK